MVDLNLSTVKTDAYQTGFRPIGITVFLDTKKIKKNKVVSAQTFLVFLKNICIIDTVGNIVFGVT